MAAGGASGCGRSVGGCGNDRESFAGAGRFRRLLACTKGQGTTEYAILVGVLVVIAIIAIVAFKGKLEELWSAIAEGINGL
jgi:Flp pilus assembly pilin Flp